VYVGLVGVAIVAALSGCSGANQTAPSAFCPTARGIQQENANLPPVTSIQQEARRLTDQVERLAPISTSRVRLALLKLDADLRPAADGAAIGMTPSAAATQAKQAQAAVATVDAALRNSCALDVSVLGVNRLGWAAAI